MANIRRLGSVALLAAASIAGSAVAQNTFDMLVVPLGLVAEDQTPSGRFLTAQETKPILNATKANWVAVREFDGQDLIYVTHLWSWRCGLAALAIGVNGLPLQNWTLPACHADTASPNAILEGDGDPYFPMPLGSVHTVEIQIVYDDLSLDRAQLNRQGVLIP